MKRIFIFFTTLAILSCKGNSDTKTGDSQDSPDTGTRTDTVTEQRPAADPVADTLMKLPFIIKSNQYIDSLSNHRHGIAFIADTTDQEINVKAGYNGAERFETYYHFTIDRKTGEIKIMDMVKGDYIPLKDYLKNNQ